MNIDNASILITGGTGSFGQAFTRYLFSHYKPRRVVIYSRDEYKQYMMQKDFEAHQPQLRFFIGDVRDRERLYRAFDGIDIVVHAAALKHVPLMEYNPIEAVKTNIRGAENIIDAAIDRGVKQVIALSTDKAVNPVNLYGATKLVSDKLFVAANAYTGDKLTSFSVVRYGNVAGSRGSIIPFFNQLIADGIKTLPITDPRMTRFWISLEEGIRLAIKAIKESSGGEIYVSKIPSFKVVDLAKAMLPEAELKIVGIRPGEKLHEVMVTETDSMNTYEYEKDFIIYPVFDRVKKAHQIVSGGKKVEEGFTYSSDKNTDWMDIDRIQSVLEYMSVDSQ